jgi:hypothetical protein
VERKEEGGHGFSGHSQANEEPAPIISNTSGPLRGLSVVRDLGSKEYRVLWPGHRMLRGIVESVSGGGVKVKTGELVSRFLSEKEALENGMLLKNGDEIQLVVNDHNLVLDYHLMGQEVWHRIIRGGLAQPYRWDMNGP